MVYTPFLHKNKQALRRATQAIQGKIYQCISKACYSRQARCINNTVGFSLEEIYQKLLSVEAPLHCRRHYTSSESTCARTAPNRHVEMVSTTSAELNYETLPIATIFATWIDGTALGLGGDFVMQFASFGLLFRRIFRVFTYTTGINVQGNLEKRQI